ncbi:Heat-inducible transcription repressor [Quillaja saponaria]|uniref:Heat-inducible transcription repressor n=1 Tax=Quillaja saponaria TaxID=32244 RepID=A0AAD7LLB1_QUISA|nr:Heat-inducible transcription repressor [Quillaja saponaria]
MAYRRRQQGISRSSTFEALEDEGTRDPLPPSSSSSSSSSGSSASVVDSSLSSSSSSLAAKAIRASSARRDSSLSSAYGHSNVSYTSRIAEPTRSSAKDSNPYEYTSMKSLNESKHGFWGVLARKAKAILEDDNVALTSDSPGRMSPKSPGTATRSKYHDPNDFEESNRKKDSPTLLKGFDAITSSLSHIGGTIGNAFEEGRTIVENRTSDIIQETRKHIRKKPNNFEGQNQQLNRSTGQQPQFSNQTHPQMQTGQELQLKASRDVAMAMAAKAKLLLRELKTVKADLAFAKERCAQLEEENKILRENRDRGDNPEDDDLIRLQLESLLAEKARLAHENSIYARENRFLREVVEFHQLTMQDVVYFDEGNEEVTEVYPVNIPSMSSMHSVNDTALDISPQVTRNSSSFPTTENDTN